MIRNAVNRPQSSLSFMTYFRAPISSTVSRERCNSHGWARTDDVIHCIASLKHYSIPWTIQA